MHEQFFQKHTNSAKKKVGKKSSEKNAKKRFLYSHEYRDHKMGGKNARNNFSRNTRIVRTKKCSENNRRKNCEKTFFFHTNIVTKKWGQRNARNNLSRNTNRAI